MKKKQAFEWSEACQQAFIELKKNIINAVELKPFVTSDHTVIYTDASMYCLGAVLVQVRKGKENVIAFSSRTLRGAETTYSAIEKEALACWWGVQHLRNYVWGRKFDLRTDHKPLVDIFTTKGASRASPRIAKWLYRLQEYNFAVEYVPGVANVNADCLSRLPMEGVKYEEDGDWVVADIHAIETKAIKEEVWKTEMLEDVVMQTILTNLNKHWGELGDDVLEMLSNFKCVWSELSEQGGVLRRGNKVLVPHKLRENILGMLHEGHGGMSGMKRKAREDFWWPGMDRDVEKFVRNCLCCACSDKTHIGKSTSVVPIPFPHKPWERVGMDVCGPFNLEGEGKTFAIVMMDYHSKWPEVSLVRDVRSSVIIELCEEIWRREGYPEVLVTDNGPQFTSSEFENYLECCGVKHIKTAIAHPRENGLVERFNRVLGENIQLALQSGLNWRNKIKDMLWSYRTTPHSLTMETPFMLLKGRKPCTRAVPGWMGKAGWKRVDEGGLIGCVMDMQGKYEGKAMGRVMERELAVGDWVRTKVWDKTKKGGSKWSIPKRIVKVRRYSVELEDGRRWNVESVVNCNELELRKWKSEIEDGGREESHVGLRGREKRVVKSPEYLKDYVI
ncbi:hypothetical protein NDU88_004191 [Pleurodeles waltl]|uniref:Gypsy retrotransposon integrase-like protein 1 n=1 Tax=Pleurodeles waltl TaxID=8319 RepID=A0AAV7WRL5_PLEWA|nr:hypothetical protein NDU88_004191 [Pleurodeles waltl]